MIETATLLNLPCTVKGFVKITAEPDGDYPTVVLNSRHTRETNILTMGHENSHIEGDDAYRGENADQIERERHGLG